jgi:hypothetical protein
MRMHPRHAAVERGSGFPVKPIRDTSPWYRWKRERACHKTGGHWWHIESGSLIDWFCCQCGAERDGMPQDGSR